MVAVLALAADQLTKQAIADWLGADEPSHRYELLGSLIAFHYTENTGVAFGLLRGQTVLVAILALLVVGLLTRMYRSAQATAPVPVIGCGLVLGGAAGNLVDRVRLGYVVDFIAVSVWPKFNVADSAITVGALMLAWTYLRQTEVRQPHGPNDGAAGRPIGALTRESER